MFMLNDMLFSVNEMSASKTPANARMKVSKDLATNDTTCGTIRNADEKYAEYR